MPDLDHLPRRVSRHWRQARAVAAGREDYITVADCSEKAMTATLRSGAAEYLPRLANALGVEPGSRQVEIERVISRLPRRWVTGIGYGFVVAARMQARGVDLPDYPTSGVVLTALVANGLRRMAWQLCFAPMEPEVVPDVFGSVGEYDRYVWGCLGEVRFDRLANEVARHPDPSKIRAPRRRRKRKSTKELLHEPI